MATREDENGILLHRHVDLSSTEIELLKSLDERASAELRTMRENLRLQCQDEDPRHELYAAFSLLWADLVDIQPAKLVRYGIVAPEAAALLQPSVERLIEMSTEFVAILQKPEAELGR